MKRGAVGFVFLAILFLSSWALYAAEEPKPAAPEAKPAADEPKPLGPGLLSLDSTVGIVDKKIEEGKAVVEKALGIGISGFFDSSWTWASTHPGNANGHHLSGRYFDQDYNQDRKSVV